MPELKHVRAPSQAFVLVFSACYVTLERKKKVAQESFRTEREEGRRYLGGSRSGVGGGGGEGWEIAGKCVSMSVSQCVLCVCPCVCVFLSLSLSLSLCLSVSLSLCLSVSLSLPPSLPPSELVGIRSTEIGAKSLFDGSTQIKLKYIKIEGYRLT
jgi:hypothetical protein